MLLLYKSLVIPSGVAGQGGPGGPDPPGSAAGTHVHRRDPMSICYNYVPTTKTIYLCKFRLYLCAFFSDKVCTSALQNAHTDI